MRDRNVTVTQNALDHRIVDSKTVEVRSKAAAKCVPSMPPWENFIADILVLCLGVMLRFWLATNSTDADGRKNYSANQVLQFTR